MKFLLIVVCAASFVLNCCGGWIIQGGFSGADGRPRRPASFTCWSTNTPTSTTTNNMKNQKDILLLTFRELGFENEDELQAALETECLWNSNSSHILRTICRDYYTCRQPDQLSRMLQDDFHLKPLQAHSVRTTLWRIYAQQDLDLVTESEYTHDAKPLERLLSAVDDKISSHRLVETSDDSSSSTVLLKNVSRPLYKEVQLRSKHSSHDQFWHEFMTRPNPYHPTATPLRNATAKVYATHATLFLGWYLQHGVKANPMANNNAYSLRTIFEDSSEQSVSVLLDFVRWLRENRNIASSYEANVWRGLTKLLQFRYSQLEGKTAAALENLPALLQIRKWHREASKAAAKAPRRSQEDRKWLSWGEYLHVVNQCKQEFLALEKDYLVSGKHPSITAEELATPEERKIAVALQRYLVLAIFATVPDRQRTIRELEINKSLVKDPRTGMWSIKHSQNDYKTGKTYGERPSLQLQGLTDDIDLFLQHWRPKLQPLTDLVFVQQRTRKPLTQDSVYQIVGRACYQFTGQRTNPHLLRDMIVTHVRESTTTSEAELEALAMLMGHSVAIQRASYDRRTLTQKVAPAIELMQQVNGKSGGMAFSAKAVS
eukprot:scaffold2554_cov156-Amphora_coffeaeformis.AAC.6